MTENRAKWISELKREILGDVPGKIEVLEREIEKLSRKIDIFSSQDRETLAGITNELEKINSAQHESRICKIEEELEL